MDIACYCLDINADFAQFQKKCVRLNGGWNDIFIIKNATQNPFRLIQVTYIACCIKFVDLQIDLFAKAELPLRTIDCNYSWTTADADFDYEDSFLEIYYDSDDSDNNDNSFSKGQTNILPNLSGPFLMYLTRKLHILFSEKKC